MTLQENVEHVPVPVDSAPEPEFHAIDRNDDLIQMPFVACTRSVASDATGEMGAKPVHPQADGLTADDDAALGEQIRDICRTQGEPMVGPDRIGNDRAWKTEAFEARHGRWGAHDERLTRREKAINLAMPIQAIESACQVKLYIAASEDRTASELETAIEVTGAGEGPARPA